MISVKLPLQSSIITVMTKAAIKASKGLLRDFSELENLQVSVKSNRTFVTSADIRANKILMEELTHARPTYSLLSEEAKEIVGSDPEYRWIIDPLDGTNNYMHGFPHWAISIALEKNSEVIAAVTYDPVKNELFWAEKGYGAYVNDKKIRVSGKKDLIDLLVSCGHLDETGMNWISTYQNSIRRTGSMALDMAYVAAGRIDLMFSAYRKNNIWDVAAGMLLIKEAGGIIASKDGKITNDYNEVTIMTNIDVLSSLINRKVG